MRDRITMTNGFWVMPALLIIGAMLFLLAQPVYAQNGQDTDDGDPCAVLRATPETIPNMTPAQALDTSGLQMASVNDYDTAIVLFSQAISTDPEYLDAYVHRGCAYLAQGSADEGIADLQQFIVQSEDAERVADVQAVVDSYAGDPEACVAGTTYTNQQQARDILVGFVADNATADDFNDRGLAYICLGDFDDAVRDFSAALDLDKTNTAYYNNRGFVFGLQDRYEDALNDYALALSADPENDVAHNNYGHALLQLGRYEEALESLNTALDINPTYTFALTNRGDVYEALGELDLAIADYTRALEVNPQADNYYNLRGLLYLDVPNYPNALADFERASELQPDNAVYRYNQGYTLYYAGQSEEAVTRFSEAVAINPNYVNALDWRGYVYWQMDEPALCIADYTLIFSLGTNNDDPVLWNTRGLCYHDLCVMLFQKLIRRNYLGEISDKARLVPTKNP
jgi:tetratricopeptide (TPR) repeat protein